VNYLFTPPDNGYISNARILVESLRRICSNANLYFTLSGQMRPEIECAVSDRVLTLDQLDTQRALLLEQNCKVRAGVARLSKQIEILRCRPACEKDRQTGGSGPKTSRVCSPAGIARRVGLTLSTLIPTVSMLIS